MLLKFAYKMVHNKSHQVIRALMLIKHTVNGISHLFPIALKTKASF